ncbi:MAG TPA: LamG domain-containing protein, partial [Bacteroidia bacterium]|nr:LamG domain-containing protein [Bacteroidia bacterium]
DGYGDINASMTVSVLCGPPAGYVTIATDCNDAVATAHPPFALPSGAVVYLPFNGNANDAGPQGNNGVVHNATLTTDRFGTANSAYDFNGTNAYIEVANNGSFNIGDLTLSAWINPNPAAPAGNGTILSKGFGVGSANSWNLYYENSDGFFGSEFGADPLSGFLDYNYSATGNWVHVAFTFSPNSGTAKMFVDGIPVSTIAAPTISLGADAHSLLIGADETSSLSAFFNGKIDEVLVFGRELSEEEIRRIYSGSASGVEVLNGIDDNCDSQIDEGLLHTWVVEENGANGAFTNITDALAAANSWDSILIYPRA